MNILPHVELTKSNDSAFLKDWALKPYDWEKYPENTSRLDYIAEGCKRWCDVDDVDEIAVVATSGHSTKIYDECLKAIDGRAKLICGNKCRSLLGDDHDDYLDDWWAWNQISTEIKGDTAQTGHAKAILDMETVLQPFFRGQAEIDWTGLEVVLGQTIANDPVEWWLYPVRIKADTAQNPNLRRDTTRLVELFARVLPTCKFMLSYTVKRAWWNKQEEEVHPRMEMHDLVGRDRCIDRFICPWNGRDDYWMPHRALQEAKALGCDNPSFYPMSESWEPTAKVMARI